MVEVDGLAVVDHSDVCQLGVVLVILHDVDGRGVAWIERVDLAPDALRCDGSAAAFLELHLRRPGAVGEGERRAVGVAVGEEGHVLERRGASTGIDVVAAGARRRHQRIVLATEKHCAERLFHPCVTYIIIGVDGDEHVAAVVGRHAEAHEAAGGVAFVVESV